MEGKGEERSECLEQEAGMEEEHGEQDAVGEEIETQAPGVVVITKAEEKSSRQEKVWTKDPQCNALLALPGSRNSKNKKSVGRVQIDMQREKLQGNVPRCWTADNQVDIVQLEEDVVVKQLELGILSPPWDDIRVITDTTEESFKKSKYSVWDDLKDNSNEYNRIIPRFSSYAQKLMVRSKQFLTICKCHELWQDGKADCDVGRLLHRTYSTITDNNFIISEVRLFYFA